ncbi:hypothetical protein TCAL_11142 [Tigriopus californicus]|uniref:Uncharacterized protein n=1 Tax=Tigriopus californicus TaxID=6832 RepID=A0A553N8G3_TIGCA|nr:uncharacterized protein LOC131884513 [Tigriopus californicus]TRY61727.1 hypothetical protein TCAL_11142 [Tigriopus californicus]|eukprot:TCALIF_11142-PA protein Name:"Protein of unknown function" AED:0.32 eAED:0.32 QI:40/1/1/1/0.8/0.83/6/98/307
MPMLECLLNHWIQTRHLSLTAFVSKRYLPNSHKAHRLAPNYLIKQTMEEKQRIAKVLKRNRRSPVDLLRLSPRHVAIYNAQLARAIGRALVMPELKSHFYGKGVNISKVYSSPDGKDVSVFWFSTQSKAKDVISKALNEHRSEITDALSKAMEGSQVPQLKFRYDERHLASGYLEDNFSLVEDALKMAEQDEALQTPNERPSLNSASRKATLFDEICRMPLRNDLFGVHRDVILTEIYQARHLAMASHRITPKSGVNDPLVNEFEGYLDKHYDNDSKTDVEGRVKRFLGNKKRMFYKAIKTEEQYVD